MTAVKENEPLSLWTTFKLGGPARYLMDLSNPQDLGEAAAFARENSVPIFVLGGGSNLLVGSGGYPGLVIKISFRGFQSTRSSEGVKVSLSAGETWDNVPIFSSGLGFFGLENLSGIPGSLGGAIVQNIGAYGVELSEFVEEVEAWSIKEAKFKIFNKSECNFGYRQSIFKNNEGLVVTRATLFLPKDRTPELSYKDLASLRSITSVKPAQVRETVLKAREAKLPDWREVGTAGSFFKNPVVRREVFRNLALKYADIPYIPQGDMVKIPAGWLLDKIGNFRGVREGSAYVYEKHALALVSGGGGRSEDVISLARKMRKKVLEETGIALEPEVVTLGAEL